LSGRLIEGGVVAGVSCTGRRPKNEDALLIAPLDKGYLLAIADGIGGHHAGEVASGIAVDVLEHHVRSGLQEEGTEDPEHLLEDGFSLAHQAIIDAATGERQGMGTTLVAALVLGQDLYIAHSGDSRAYVIDEHIAFRTRDHSVIQSLIDKDLIQETERSHHPLRCYLTRCLGGTFGMDTVHLTLHPSDILLLSSDGFHEYVPEPEIIRIYRTPDLGSGIRSLVSGALRRSDDNVSIILFRFQPWDTDNERGLITETVYSCPDI
jgi:protein phosphatase